MLINSGATAVDVALLCKSLKNSRWQGYQMRIRIFSFVLSFLVFWGLLSAVSKGNVETSPIIQQPATSPTRRAVLVGINLYQPSVGLNDCGPLSEPAPGSSAKISKSPVTTTKAQRIPPSPTNQSKGGVVSGTPGRSAFGNLCGPAKDIQDMNAILKSKYGFTEIKILRDQEATREAILQTITKHLVDDARPGDIALFFYSGHGSKVKNSASNEDDKYDESLVPADSYRGARDIRDKELAELYHKALDKGVILTVISDSCHSGSNARGSGYPIQERVRALPFDENDVNDGKRRDKSPEDRGALVLSAAQDYQEAKERMRGGIWRGNLAFALVNVLKSPAVSINEPAERIYQRVVAFMKGEGVGEQPVISGGDRRLKKTLFGWDANSADNSPTVAVIKKEGNLVTLQGGLALGLNIDSELKKVSDNSDKAVRLRVTKLDGLDSCEAMMIAGSAASIAKDDLFVLDRWVNRGRTNLTVWIPAAMDFKELQRQIKDLAKLKSSTKIQWVDDPTEAHPTNTNLPTGVVYYENGWKMTLDGISLDLGTTLSAATLATELNKYPQVRLFVHLPPTTELKQRLQIGKGTRREAIAVTQVKADAQYFLVGRWHDDTIEYAWVRPGVEGKTAGNSTDPLPVRSDWFAVDGTTETLTTSGEGLEDRVTVLGKVRGWLQLEAASEGRRFPYKLALRKAGTNEIIRDDCQKNGAPLPCEVSEGQNYDLVLVADPEELKQGVTRQRVYVFSIDSAGTGALLFNRNGNVENRIPKNPESPQPVELLGTLGMVQMAPPFGLDTYILIATDDEVGLSDPKILEFAGAVQRKGSQNPFESLIDDLRTGSRGPVSNVPLNWSIERMFLRSIAKSK
jgi:hypothetical protein